MNPISSLLSDWYQLNHRPLPWRETSDPYNIWVSEVILQQTRVDQGLEYFLRFVSKWPDVHLLAIADDDEVMKMWQGLGYYSRARNLLAGARQVVKEYNGVVPSDYDKLLKIKGIGKYTAAAIASIAFNNPVAVVDGNVARVLSRLFAIKEPVNSPEGERQVYAVARDLLDTHNPGRHNQAMMEFGALVCLPRSPKCNECVVYQHCQARMLDIQKLLPTKKPIKPVRVRWFSYLVIRVQSDGKPESVLIEKRHGDDIWNGMYQFPLIESEAELSSAEVTKLAAPLLDVLGQWKAGPRLQARPHQLTHQRIMASFQEFTLHPGVDIRLPNGLSLANTEQLNQKPFPRLIEWYLYKSNMQTLD